MDSVDKISNAMEVINQELEKLRLDNSKKAERIVDLEKQVLELTNALHQALRQNASRSPFAGSPQGNVREKPKLLTQTRPRQLLREFEQQKPENAVKLKQKAHVERRIARLNCLFSMKEEDADLPDWSALEEKQDRYLQYDRLDCSQELALKDLNYWFVFKGYMVHGNVVSNNFRLQCRKCGEWTGGNGGPNISFGNAVKHLNCHGIPNKEIAELISIVKTNELPWPF